MSQRLGILGGSFNPPHIAHKIAAEFCRDELSLDKIVFMPSGNHPLKESADHKHRFNMAKIAFGSDDNFEVSDYELRSAGEKTFTIDTLRHFKHLHKSEAVLVLLIGADNLLELHKWKEPDLLFELAEVAVMRRPGFDLSKAEKQFLDKSVIIDIPLMDISSTMIRDRISMGRSVKYIVDGKVEDYIKNNKLYT